MEDSYPMSVRVLDGKHVTRLSARLSGIGVIGAEGDGDRKRPRGTTAVLKEKAIRLSPLNSYGLTLLLLLTTTATVVAHPAQIILLRHAEKPPHESSVHLSDRGHTRAQALVKFLSTGPVLGTNGLPEGLFRAGVHQTRPWHSAVRNSPAAGARLKTAGADAVSFDGLRTTRQAHPEGPCILG